jgi:pseudaminic acid synthase
MMEIAGRAVGAGEPMYVIAELSANHMQRYDLAERLVREAAAAGADAVKLQTYTPDTITLNSDAPPFRILSDSLWAGRRLYELYEDAYTPWEWHESLARVAASEGVHLFSTPFDPSAVEFLVEQGVPALKIASFEIVDHGLIAAAAATGKPMILSTGMATLAEIDEAVRVARGAGATQLALLRCNSGYPAPVDEMHLVTIPHLRDAFDVVVGFSDHTRGTEASIVARTLGATILEKHFVLDRSSGALDADFSLEPAEFKAMVRSIRAAEQMLGTIRYGPTAAETPSARHRRSLFVVEDTAAGEALTTRNVRSIRPGGGLHPRHLEDVLGATARVAISRGTPLSWRHLA